MPNLTVTVGATETNTTVFFTRFEINRAEPVFVGELYYPIVGAPASGLLYCKATIFQEQPATVGRSGFPWKEYDPDLRFKIEGIDPTAAAEPILISMTPTTNPAKHLPRGNYWLAHIYGTNAGASILTSVVIKTRNHGNYNGTGTDNHFRGDWTATGGNYPTIDWSAIEFLTATCNSGGLGTLTGSTAGTQAQTNWGLGVRI